MVSLLVLGCAVIGSFEWRHRRMMAHVAAIERLGGNVAMESRAPDLMYRLRPDVFEMFGRGAGVPRLGPNWLRKCLQVNRILRYFDVVIEVRLDNGPGMYLQSNYSGQRRRVDDVTITDDDLAHIAMFPSLERLYLRETKASDAGMQNLRNLRHLKALYLSKTRITDASIEIISRFSELETLRLVDDDITNAGIAKLAVLEHLQELDVRGTKVTDNGLKPFSGRKDLEIEIERPGDLRFRVSW